MRCRWYLFALAALLAFRASAGAQPPREPKDGKVVVPLTVDAAPPPVPAMKYLLLPELRDTQPGNQVPAFYKCFMEQNHLFFGKETVAQRDKWLAAPLAELKGVKELAGYGGAAARQADYAARLETVNWQIIDQMKVEGIALLLSDVQQLRSLAAVLKLKLRGEIARGEFDNATRTVQTLLALARTFTEHPTLIGNLVGIAIATMTVDAIEEWVEQPGAPNLFWALTDLPAPFIGLRKGMHGERALLHKDFDILQTSAPIPGKDLKSLIARLELIGPVTIDKKPWAATKWYDKQAGDPTAVAAAKDRLAKHGHKPADLDKLVPLQLVLMDDFLRYIVFRDDMMKWTNVPFPEIPTDLWRQATPPGILPELVTASIRVVMAQMRLQQRIAMLQVTEAVRMHAAKNGGKLPTALTDVKLPLPIDPVTGKPFRYEVQGATAVIRGTPPDDRKNDPLFNRVYELKIRK